MLVLAGQYYIAYVKYRYHPHIMQKSIAYHYYLDFHLIAPDDYRGLIKFYEQHYHHLTGLEAQQKLEIDIDYINAVFETGNYYLFLDKVDSLIEDVIFYNIYTYNDDKIFEKLLFRKAASLHNIHKYEKSLNILNSLIKIDPESSLNKKLMAKCIRKKKCIWYETMKGIAIVLLLSTVSIYIAEELIVGPFYKQHLAHISSWRVVLFTVAIGLLITRELAMYFKIKKEISIS